MIVRHFYDRHIRKAPPLESEELIEMLSKMTLRSDTRKTQEQWNQSSDSIGGNHSPDTPEEVVDNTENKQSMTDQVIESQTKNLTQTMYNIKNNLQPDKFNKWSIYQYGMIRIRMYRLVWMMSAP